MATKKYINLSNLSVFLDGLKTKFAALTHAHSISEITDYTVDNALSPDSTNPVQNKVIDSEFEAVSTAMNALDSAIDNKADKIHNHDDIYYTEAEIDTKVGELNTVISGKADASHTHDDRYYTKTETDTALSHYTETDPTVPAWAKAATKPSYTAAEVGAMPNTTIIPDSLADLTADSTHRLVTDAEKSTWNAKSNFSGNYNDLTNKPTIPSINGLATETYVNEKISAIPTPDVSGQINTHNTSTSAHTDIREELSQLSSEKVNFSDVPFVTPQMYGAKGDGVTDDTAAFQDALANNDSVFVPSGKYLIKNTIDISYKKSLFSNAGQRATILYQGTNSVVSIGRLSVFRNINITLKSAFGGIVFDTNNYNKNSGEPALSSRVEHINVDFEVYSPNATLIGITMDSGTDANDIPRLSGVCFQTYHDIHVDNSSEGYGYGIKMELVQGRAFTEETKAGFPWITHIDYDDISLGHPHTAIKAGVTNTSGAEHFERVSIGHILFNNVYTQYINDTITRYFLNLDNFGGYFTKCVGWDYHTLGWAGEKCNIIGENVQACFSDCEMSFGAEFLKSCDFTAENEYSVESNPEYFINKYFKGSVLQNGYDSVDAKIDAKLTGEFVANVAEEKINDVLYSGYSNVLADPLTNILVGKRWSYSGNSWVDTTDDTIVVIPLVTGGNIIRWTPTEYLLSNMHAYLYFFKDDSLTQSVQIGSYIDMGVSANSGRLDIENPSGYKYLAIPFRYYTDISSDTMTMTINREITGNDGKSYTEYLRESVIDPAVSAKVAEEFGKVTIPTKTSQLTNDSGFLTQHQSLSGYAKKTDIPTKTSQITNDSGFITAKDIPEAQVPDLSGYALKSSAETWTFTLANGSTVTKKVVLA